MRGFTTRPTRCCAGMSAILHPLPLHVQPDNPLMARSCLASVIATDISIRLEDELGEPVSDIYRTLRDVEVVVFYAGSAQGAREF